jgi:hypothetical protein
VLVVVIVLALAAYTFSDLMLAHRRVADMSGKQLQSRMLVYSGMDAVKMYLMQDEATRIESGGHFDNPAYFQAATVIPEIDPNFRGSFTVLAPFIDEEGLSMGGVRYGLEDESTRLNLNLLLVADDILPGSGRDLLMALPGMTEDVADAILDWMDEDEDTRDYGAESLDYYSTLTPAYEPRNGPLQSVEELLLVRGVLPELLFGSDFNRNGAVDPHEQSMATSLGMGGVSAGLSTTATADSLAALPERGWSSYLTIYSNERNANSVGLPRIYLNGDDLETLQSELSEVFSDEQTNFILAYRLYGPASAEGGENGEEMEVQTADELELDLSQEPQGQLKQVLDLIGATVLIKTEGDGEQQEQAVMVNSPFSVELLAMASYMKTLMDNCTITESEAITGRININEAQREILLGIPAVSTDSGEKIMTEELVDEIIRRRAAGDSADRSHETWLLSEAVLTLDEMRAITPFVCAGGDVFRCQIVGYFQGGGPATRAEVVFDATGDTPRVLFWRDISHLGRGHALETLGVDLVEGLTNQ